MAEAPDLASMYDVNLFDAYETVDRLKDSETMQQVRKSRAILTG
jgi:hypothetical protein